MVLAALFCLSGASGQVPQEKASPPPVPSSRVITRPLYARWDLRKLRSEGRFEEATELAKKVLTTLPVLDRNPQGNGVAVRPEALMILKETDAIAGYISELEKRLEQQPDDIEAILALAEANTFTDQASGPAYYERAAKLAPGRVDIDLRLAAALSRAGRDEEAIFLYDSLLKRDLGRTLTEARETLTPLYSKQNELPRFAAAIAEGCKPPLNEPPYRTTYLTQIGELTQRLAEAGHEDEVINILAAVTRSSYSKAFLARLEIRLIDLLIKHERNQEAIHEMVRLFSPAPEIYQPSRWEFATTLMSWEGEPINKPNCLALDLTRKTQAIGGLDQLVASVRADAEKHSEEMSEQTLFAMVLVAGRVPEAMSFLPRYFERVSGLPPERSLKLTLQDKAPVESHSPQNVSSKMLLALADELRAWPAAKSLVYPALTAAQSAYARSEDHRQDFEGLWPDIARITMEMDDSTRAREVLQKLLVMIEQSPKRLRSTEQVLALFEMMLRTKMEREAKTVLEVIQDPKGTRSGTSQATRLNRAARVAVDAGRIDLAKSTAKLLPAVIEKALYDAELRPEEVTASAEILLELNLVPDLEQTLASIRRSGAEGQGFISVVDGAQRLIEIHAGSARGLSPTIFLMPGAEPNMKGMARWDLAGRVTPPRFGDEDRPIFTLFDGTPPPLPRSYRLDIRAGQLPEQLERIATIKNPARRGGAPVALKASTRFVRGILTDESGFTFIGSPTEVNASPNLVANSNFDGLPALTAMNHSGRQIDGWGKLPEGDWSFAANGPLGRSIRYRSNAQKQTIISGQRIPVERADEFFQSCWIRNLPLEARIRVGRRYLNRDGGELKVSFCRDQENSGGWSLLKQKLELRHRGPNGEIPGGCAFIEPILELTTYGFPNALGQLAVWSGLYLGKIVPPPGENQIDPNESIFFSEKESPTHLSVSADSRFIAAGYQNGLVRVLDRQGDVIATAPENFQPTVALRFLRDVPQLISFGAGGEIRRITVQPASIGKMNTFTSGTILNADITPDGAYAVIFARGKGEQSNGGPGKFEVLDLTTGETVRTIDSDWAGIHNLTVSEDGSRFYGLGIARPYPPGLWLLPSGEKIGFSAEEVAAGIDPVKVLGLKHPVSVDTFPGSTNAYTVCADPQRDRSIIAREGKIFVYDRISRKNVWAFHNAGKIRRLIVIPDTGAILSIGEDTAIHQWTVPSTATRK